MLSIDLEYISSSEKHHNLEIAKIAKNNKFTIFLTL